MAFKMNICRSHVYIVSCRYDDDDQVTAFPVVKETADKLIETGINTLQRTLLLKKEVEVDQVQSELEAKRHEFKQRMDACAQRQIEIQKKQQRVCVKKYRKFAIYFLINQFKHVFWVLKRTVSSRRFF